MSPLSIIRTARRPGRCWTLALLLAAAAPAAVSASDLGRLFYTAEQRAQLEAARARGTAAASSVGTRAAGETSPAQRSDGVLIRSDGKTTRWIDGKLQADGNAVSGLKPGQMRSGGKVYEPYQVLPAATAPVLREEAP